MLKKGADNIVSGSDEPFGLAVLRRGVRARKTIGDAVGGEEVTESCIDEFAAVVALHSFDDDVKLSIHEREEALEGGRCVGFGAKWKGPGVMCIIIQNNQIILITREAYNGRGP